MLHIVSDLELDLHDRAEDQLKINSNTKYIIVPGNISDTNKRSMLYAETLAKLYPNSYIIYNYGLLESYDAEWGKMVDGFELYINDFKRAQPNLYHPKGAIIGNYDFYCTVGWPTFWSDKDFNNSYIKTNIWLSVNEEFYIDDILMSSKMPTYPTIDFVKNQIKMEEEKIQNWLDKDTGVQKILVSNIGNSSYNYMKTTNFKIFPNLDLKNVVWICGGAEEIIKVDNNYKTICLPGKNRKRYLTLDTFELIVTDF